MKQLVQNMEEERVVVSRNFDGRRGACLLPPPPPPPQMPVDIEQSLSSAFCHTLEKESIAVPILCFSPLERGWRKQKEGTLHQPKVRLRQEVVSVSPQKRGQRITVPVRKLFAKEKRPYGLGMVGKLTNRTYRKRIDSYVKRQIEDMDDHR